jgi:hypothetical protein
MTVEQLLSRRAALTTELETTALGPKFHEIDEEMISVDRQIREMRSPKWKAPAPPPPPTLYRPPLLPESVGDPGELESEHWRSTTAIANGVLEWTHKFAKGEDQEDVRFTFEFVLSLCSFLAAMREKRNILENQVSQLTNELGAVRIAMGELQRHEFKYLGLWEADKSYTKNSSVTYDGSLWICTTDFVRGTPPDLSGGEWRLAVKRGRDAPRDARR